MSVEVRNLWCLPLYGMITHNRIPNDLRVVNYKKKQEKDTKHIEIQGVKSDLKR